LTVLLSSRETDLARTEVAARARMRNNFISLKNAGWIVRKLRVAGGGGVRK
jgi:hypothetical protein